MNASSRDTRPRGQIIVIAVIALVAIVGMTGLVLDGGALFAQQRTAQNGSDAAATAGAVVIAENLGSRTDIRTNQDVWDAIDAITVDNGLQGWTAEYTDDYGSPIGVQVTDSAGAIPPNARGVSAGGSRAVDTTFSRIFGFDQLQATARATVVAGALSGECVLDEDGCTLLPVTFPIQVYQCDAGGDLIPGPWIGQPPPGADPSDPYWPTVGAESLPGSASFPNGDTSKMAILPLCRSASGGSGAFGWLDLVPSMNLAEEIDGPLNTTVDIPDWFQTQPGNPNSVEDELLAHYRKPVLLPLNNGACRQDPGASSVCSTPGTDPAGNNTWYYVHTLAVFYIEHVFVQGSNVDQCSSAPGLYPAPTTSGGFLGCLKGWFVNYVTSGPITPGEPIVRGQTSIGIQLIN